jgi:hypothetical protein
MGWNTGYTIFEATVVGAYDLGKLDKALLSVLMEPYRRSDIDSGGEMGLRSKDGKDVTRIVIETWGLPYPELPDLPEDYRTWTVHQRDMSDTYQELVWDTFRRITKEFGWC